MTIDRRKFFGIAAGTSASLALTPELLRALQRSGVDMSRLPAAPMILRAIPKTGEKLPVISFAARPSAPGALNPVLKTFVDNGGKVLDTMHGGPEGEKAAGAAANAVGVQNKLFWTTVLSVQVPVLPGYSGPPLKVESAAIRAYADAKMKLFNVPKIDVFMLTPSADLDTHLAVAREMKKEGKVRYIGVHDLLFPPNVPAPAPPTARLESIIRNEEIDFIGVDYSAGDRRIEETLLPLAMERKVGVMAYFVFDRGRLFKRIGNTPLPAWAAEFDAKTWAQFLLKYVISHPGVTVAREGTTNAEHMLDNLGGGMGRLPDEAMRKRMAQLIDSLPPTPPSGPPPQQAPKAAPIVLSAAILDRYAGEFRYAVTGQTVRFRRDGERLLMKVSGPTPEVPIAARSETSFEGPFEMTFDFQVDNRGKVTGATAGQGPNRMLLEPIAPVILSVTVLDRYVGEYKAPSGFIVTFRREGASLYVKPGTNPESVLIARSEIRFEDPRGPAFEFQVDAQGRVTGAVLQQGAGQPLTLSRQ